MLDGLGLIPRLDDGVALPLERVAQHRAERVLVFDEKDLSGRSGHAGGRQRSQPGGTPALRASSSISAICFLPRSTSSLTRPSSASASARCSPTAMRLAPPSGS